MDMFTWLPWVTRNQNHHWLRGPVHSPYGWILAGFQVREQRGFGIVDIAVWAKNLHDQSEEQWVPWLMRNDEYDWERAPFVVPRDHVLMGLEVREQGGYGIVDMRCIYREGGNPRDQLSAWFCDNPNGYVLRTICPDDQAVTGVEAAEQGGFGFINCRIGHTSLDVIMP